MPLQLKYPAPTLHGKHITFSIHLPDGGIADGIGQLIVNGPDTVGEYSAFIDVTIYPDNHSGVGRQDTYQIPMYQAAMDCLEVLDNGNLSCVDPTIPSD